MRARWTEREHGYDKKGRIILRWTCCNACLSEHKSLLLARLHYFWLKVIGVAP